MPNTGDDPAYWCTCPPWVRKCDPGCPSLIPPEKRKPSAAALEDNCTVGAGVPSRVYTRDVAIAASLRAKGATGRCVKCSRVSGDNWEQCEGACPMPISPHYDELTGRAFEVLPLAKQDEYGRAETRLHEDA